MFRSNQKRPSRSSDTEDDGDDGNKQLRLNEESSEDDAAEPFIANPPSSSSSSSSSSFPTTSQLEFDLTSMLAIVDRLADERVALAKLLNASPELNSDVKRGVLQRMQIAGNELRTAYAVAQRLIDALKRSDYSEYTSPLNQVQAEEIKKLLFQTIKVYGSLIDTVEA